MAGGDRALRSVEHDLGSAAIEVDSAPLVGLSVARLGHAVSRPGLGEPVQLRSAERLGRQIGLGLGNHQCVGGPILLHDIPRFFRSVPAPTNADALTLAKRIERQTAMFAEQGARRVDDGTGLFGDVTGEEIGETTFADEADSGAVLLIVDVEARAARPSPDLGLV